MADIFLTFETPVADGDGRSYTARACGRESDGGRWEGAWHLRNVVQAYALADEHRVDLEALDEPELVELIVQATRERPGGAGAPPAS